MRKTSKLLTHRADQAQPQSYRPTLETLEDRLPPGSMASSLHPWGAWDNDLLALLRETRTQERVIPSPTGREATYPGATPAAADENAALRFACRSVANGSSFEIPGTDMHPEQVPSPVAAWSDQLVTLPPGEGPPPPGHHPFLTYRSDAVAVGVIDGGSCHFQIQYVDMEGGAGLERSQAFIQDDGSSLGTTTARAASSIPDGRVSASGYASYYDPFYVCPDGFADAVGYAGYWETLAIRDPHLQLGDALPLIITVSLVSTPSQGGYYAAWAGIRDARSLPQGPFDYSHYSNTYPFDRTRDTAVEHRGSADSPVNFVRNGQAIAAFLFEYGGYAGDGSAQLSIRAENGDDLIINQVLSPHGITN